MQHLVPVDLAAFPEGYFSLRAAGPHTNMTSCRVVISRVPAGGAGPKLHTHPVDQIYYVIDGTMKLQLGTDVFGIEPGTTVLIPAGTPHRNWNDSQRAELHVQVFAPEPPEGKAIAFVGAFAVPGAARLIHSASAFGRGHDRRQDLLNRANGSENASLAMVALPPKSEGSGRHFHDVDQFHFVLEGTLTVMVGNRRFEAGPNHLVVLPAGTLHSEANESEAPERHLTLMVPEPIEGSPCDIGI